MTVSLKVTLAICMMILSASGCKEIKKVKRNELLYKDQTNKLVNDYILSELKTDSIVVFEKPVDLTYDGCFKDWIRKIKEIEFLADDKPIEGVIDLTPWSKNNMRFSKTLNQKIVADLGNNLNNWTKFNKAGYNGYYLFSKPVFSKDYTVAVMRIIFVCSTRCGHGATLLFKKINNKWSVKGSYCEIVG